MPADLPVFVRISATDWIEGGWDPAQSVVLAAGLKDLKVDLIDVSSGALSPKARIPVGKGYQVPLARQIRDEAGIMGPGAGDEGGKVVAAGRPGEVAAAKESRTAEYLATYLSRV